MSGATDCSQIRLQFIGIGGLIYIYPPVLVRLVSARDKILLVVLDADNVLPAAGETVGTRGLIEDKDVEVTVNRPLGV